MGDPVAQSSIESSNLGWRSNCGEGHGPPSGALDDPSHPEGGRPLARPAATNFVADVLEGALGRDRWGGLLHDGGVDVVRLVTYYTAFVIDLASRRVHVLGSRSHSSDLFMDQIVRLMTAADDGPLGGHRVLICDRDRKWSGPVRRQFADAGIRVVLTPERAPNANANAERFVRSIKEECLDQLIQLGERHFLRAVTEFVEHYHRERNHQGLGNELIAGAPTIDTTRRVRRRPRLSGLLNFYERAA
jgi:transposase InsO family protein